MGNAAPCHGCVQTAGASAKALLNPSNRLDALVTIPTLTRISAIDTGESPIGPGRFNQWSKAIEQSCSKRRASLDSIGVMAGGVRQGKRINGPWPQRGGRC